MNFNFLKRKKHDEKLHEIIIQCLDFDSIKHLWILDLANVSYKDFEWFIIYSNKNIKFVWDFIGKEKVEYLKKQRKDKILKIKND